MKISTKANFTLSSVLTAIEKHCVNESPAKRKFLIDYFSTIAKEDPEVLEDIFGNASLDDPHVFEGLSFTCDGEHGGSGSRETSFGDGEVINSLFFCEKCARRIKTDLGLDIADVVRKAIRRVYAGEGAKRNYLVDVWMKEASPADLYDEFNGKSEIKKEDFENLIMHCDGPVHYNDRSLALLFRDGVIEGNKFLCPDCVARERNKEK